MTIRRSAAFFLLAAATATISFAADPKPTPPAAPATPATPTTPTAAAEPSPLKLYLMDGSLVAGKISVPELTIDTDFGTLKVPITSIKSFSPGLASHPEFEKQLGDLVNDLGADGFAEREKAQQTLLKMGPSIAPELRRQLKSAEAEKQTRLQKILEEFDSQHEGDEDAPDTSGEWSPNDTIVTSSFTIVGHITTPGFAISSSYGTLQLKLADVRRALRDTAEPEDIKKTITVSGNLINTRGFETALKINKGDIVTIVATGTITLTPWGGNASSNPDGSPNYGTMQPGNIPTGALIAKVGSGTIFKAGSKHTFTADKAGVLQFGIAMPGNYGGNEFPGEYSVKIRITHK